MPVYVIGLAIISLVVLAAEELWPARREQRRLRSRIVSDLVYFVFNAHFLGVAMYWFSTRFLLPGFDAALARLGVTRVFHLAFAASWPLWLQLLVLVVVFDFTQWLIHRLLHAVPALWALHQVHHSVKDGEMDFIASFRFHWGEAAIYKLLQYALFPFFGFDATAVLAYAFIGTLAGHLNHGNLDLGHGRWRYVLNSPRMHLWHHDADGPTRNFGIIFSAWDWIFGTAHMPVSPPSRLGFPGDEKLPRTVLGQAVWPVQALLRRARGG